MLARLRHLFIQAKTHQGFRRYFANTSWLFGERFLRMAVGFVVSVWVTRYLGPEQFGTFSFAQSFAGIFAGLASLGLDGIITKELVKDAAKRDLILGTAFFLKLAGAAGSLLALAIAINFTSNDSKTNALVFVIASTVIFQSVNVIDFYYQAMVLGRYVVYANSVGLLLSSVVKIALVLLHAPLMAFAWSVLFDSAILAMGYLFFYTQNNLTFQAWKFDGRIARNLIKESWPFIISGIVLMVQARIDQVMLKEMTTAIEVGYYSAALRLIEVFGFIPIVMASSLFPALANAKGHSDALYKVRFLNYYRLSFLLFLITAIPIFLFAEKAVVILFGTSYQPAGALLSLMAIRLFFTNTGVARGAFINIENLAKFSMITMTIGAVINVSLNYILIPVYHGKGAVAATICSFFVTGFLVDYMYGKTRANVTLQLYAILTFYKLNSKN